MNESALQRRIIAVAYLLAGLIASVLLLLQDYTDTQSWSLIGLWCCAIHWFYAFLYEKKMFAHIADMRAGKNSGLRLLYFGLALLIWFFLIKEAASH